MVFERLKINQAYAACIATIGGFGVGISLSWTATALPSLNATGQIGNLSQSEASWIASLLTIGAMLACPITGILLNDMGRKTCLINLAVIAFPGWLLLACATNPDYVYAGRILTGISTGGYSIVVPIYISEIASKENRGRLGSMFLVMLCLGKLYSNTIGITFDASTASFLCALHPIVHGLLLLTIPESPTFLVKKSRILDAHRVLTWLNTTGISCKFLGISSSQSVDHTEAEAKLDQLQLSAKTSSIDNSAKISLMQCLKTPEILKPSATVFVLMLLCQFCGINVATFFTVEIFKLSGDILIDSHLSTVILAFIQTIGCLPASIFVDKCGRKFLLISSFIFMTIALCTFAVYFYIKDEHMSYLECHPTLGIVPLISLVVYSLAFSWGVGSIVWIIMSEILPPNVIGPASAIANILYWGGAFIVTQGFQQFNTHIPLYYWFASFALVCIFGCIFNFIALPETKGLSLQEIQLFYKKEKPVISQNPENPNNNDNCECNDKYL